MSDERSPVLRQADQPVVFGRRLAGSEAFKSMFREGMALVEETAAYLDGDGRRDSRRLPRAASLSYATESMRLTTRLMQMASWLLLQRAVNDGDMSLDQANHERGKVKLGGLSSATEGPSWDGLPERLRELIQRSLMLQQGIIRLDDALRRPVADEVRDNPVARQIGEIAAAFGVVSSGRSPA